ncbi:MAG: hypothetical protein AABW83_01240 [Nanoarchaeota archaeon]
MVLDIESIINDENELKNAFEEICESIIILMQVTLHVNNPEEYKGRIFSKEDGDKIIIAYLEKVSHPKNISNANRTRGKWDIHYPEIYSEVYSAIEI